MSFLYIHKLSFSLFSNGNNWTICSFSPFFTVHSSHDHKDIGGHEIWFIFAFHWMYYWDLYINTSQHRACKSKPAMYTSGLIFLKLRRSVPYSLWMLATNLRYFMTFIITGNFLNWRVFLSMLYKLGYLFCTGRGYYKGTDATQSWIFRSLLVK